MQTGQQRRQGLLLLSSIGAGGHRAAAGSSTGGIHGSRLVGSRATGKNKCNLCWELDGQNIPKKNHQCQYAERLKQGMSEFKATQSVVKLTQFNNVVQQKTFASHGIMKSLWDLYSGNKQTYGEALSRFKIDRSSRQ